MNQNINVHIVLENPSKAVVFGLQKGSGNQYETVQKQLFEGQNLHFECTIVVKKTSDAIVPDFSSPYVQGNKNERFIYLDIGKAAGQCDTIWSRRLKIPLRGITWEMVQTCLSNADNVLETHVAGIGKDGGPNCGTVKPFDGWQLKKITQ